MEQVPVKYERHIFVCVNEREGECCSAKGSEEIVKVLRDHVNSGRTHRFNVSKSRCLGHCPMDDAQGASFASGPTIAVYPDGLIFKKVSLSDTKKIIEEFL